MAAPLPGAISAKATTNPCEAFDQHSHPAMYSLPKALLPLPRLSIAYAGHGSVGLQPKLCLRQSAWPASAGTHMALEPAEAHQDVTIASCLVLERPTY